MEVLGVVKSVDFDKKNWMSVIRLDTGKKLKVTGDFRHLVNYEIIKDNSKYVYRKAVSGIKSGPANIRGQYLGSVVGETNTVYIEAVVNQTSERSVSILDFVIIEYEDMHILGQVVDYKRNKKGDAIVGVSLIGVLNGGMIERVPYPLVQGSKVYKATTKSVEYAFSMNDSGLYLGMIHKTDIPVYIEKKMMAIGHTAILAKIRTGKSYMVRVLSEEINKKGYPIVIFDSRSEYNFAFKNDNQKELELMKRFKIKPQSFKDRYVRFVFDEEKTPNDVLIQKDLLRHESIYSLIVKPSQISVIDLNSIKSVEEEMDIVATISKNLLELRKHDKIPPTFLVIEEAEKYIPEGKANNPAVYAISDIAMQGAQKGLDLIVVGHRPSKIKKDILSQCFNFSVLQVSWDNDKQRIKQSVEDASHYIDIISSLPVGTAFLSGAFVSRPLLVDIRTAHTKHFGQTVETNVAYTESPSNVSDIRKALKFVRRGK